MLAVAVQVIDLATIALAAEQVGGCQQLLDMTVEYTSERVQFNRTIASYQAVKHKAADMMLKTEVARSAIYYAACVAQEALEGGPLAAELSEAASVAKSYCSDAYFAIAGDALQLFGGVGFTWEYDVHLYFKRAKSSEHLLGNGAFTASAWPALCWIEGKTMKLSFSPEDEQFREEVADWLQRNLTGEFEKLKYRGGPGDEHMFPGERKVWEQKLAEGGWTCVGWPKEYGGRGCTIEQQVIFFEEYARAGAPGRVGHIGEGLAGPPLLPLVPMSRRRSTCPVSWRVPNCGARVIPSPAPAPTWPTSRPRRVLTRQGQMDYQRPEGVDLPGPRIRLLLCDRPYRSGFGGPQGTGFFPDRHGSAGYRGPAHRADHRHLGIQRGVLR